jgi:CO/xanthine dehydrogenase FAD-binding subunit
MKLWNKYHNPKTVDEAVAVLAQYGGEARVIAGGTDLIIDLRAEGGKHIQEALVDITAVQDMCHIEIDGDTVTIGGGVTHAAIVRHPELARRATALVESCGVVGGPQVRNAGTLGGNVAHALPAGDGTTSLVALDAEVEVVKDGKRQWVGIRDMFKGPGKSLLDSTKDILIGFRFQACRGHEGTAAKRVMRPQGVALPVLGCAVWVRVSEDGGTYEDVRVCLAPVAPTPVRIEAVEEILRGAAINDETLDVAVAVARDTLKPRTSKYRATSDYRAEMIEVLLRRTLPLAVERARTGEATPEGVGV